nr:hypothetical protein [Tanacetum cinerariifolium]
MHNRSYFNLTVESPLNPSTSNPKHRNRRRSKQPFILKESPVDTMADQRTMAKLLRTPTEGYAEAIVCLTTGGNTFSELRDTIQGYVAAAAVNYNKGNSCYRPPGVANQIRPSGFAQPNVQNNQNRFGQPQGYNRVNNFNQDKSYQAPNQKNQVIPLSELEKVKRMNKANMKAMQTQINNVKNELRNEMKNSIQASMSNQTNELKNMMASFFQMNTASTSGSGSLPSNTIANPKGKLKASPLEVTARALIDVHGEEMILRDGDERLALNMRHDTSSYSNQRQKESINMINIYDDSSEDSLEELFTTNHQSGNPTFSSHQKLTSPEVKDDIFDPEGCNVLIEKLLDLDSTKDLHPPHHVNPLSGSTTYSSSPNQLLEKFADELALIIFPPGNDDLSFDIETNLKKIEYLLHHDPIKDIDSILKDSSNLADLNDNLADTMPEMFTDEHVLDYSSPPLYDEYDDDLFEVESDTEYVYIDPFDSMGEKIKESKLLIDELDLPSDFIPSPEYDSFLSNGFFEVDALPSTNTEDKVFNLGILIRENLFEIITRVATDKNLAIFHASSILKDFDPPLYELPFFKEVPRSKTILPFTSENEEKVFKPGILTSEEVHSSFISELSHRGYKVFKINQILKSSIEIFLFSRREDIHILDVPCLHFYPP